MQHSLSRHFTGIFAVILLTLAGCSTMREYTRSSTQESCTAHAYLRSPVVDHIRARFPTNAPVRLAIVPFTVPENYSAPRNGVPGVGFDIARRVQARMLGEPVVPIVEVLNREDWPNKKDEFYSGNYGALSQAREAGYDLVLVGMVDAQRSMTDITSYAKLIEVESGMTLWYGRLDVGTMRDSWDSARAQFGVTDRMPNRIYFEELLEELAACVASEAFHMDPSPL